jgi:hypothetical protein
LGIIRKTKKRSRKNLKNEKMKKIIYLALILTSFTYGQKVRNAKIKVTCSASDASITVNGKSAGNGSAEVKLLANSCMKIAATKEGFYSKTVEFCNNGFTKLPKAYFIELEQDAAYEASVKTDVANVDINIRPKKSQLESWKAVNSLVLQYIDAIEISDKENFYLRTAWVANTFNSGIIRTRIIIKSAGPEQFSIKILSEKGEPGVSVKDDEKFKEWDRVLRKYSKIIEELQNRL